VILVDANLLLYAYDLRSDQHEKSRRPSLMSLVGQTLNSPSSSYVSFHRLRIWFPKPNPERPITIAIPRSLVAAERASGMSRTRMASETCATVVATATAQQPRLLQK
jgi:hypothetical protein